MEWSITQKKPSFSAAETSWAVISSILESKFAREMVGMGLSRYFVVATISKALFQLLDFLCVSYGG